ncbi:MAG TPA: RNA polymerase sigma-54 factor, partial [Brevundimonas sp.]|nr:RNA polymerase sigma-54 factor [Brevundimonas sp.]
MIGQRLEVRQGQGLVITPQLQQAIKLLQLSNLELEAFVEAELERNPLLQRDEADATGDSAPEAANDAASSDGGDEAELRFVEGSDAHAQSIDAASDDLYGDAAPGERVSDRQEEGAAAQPGLNDWSRAGPGGMADGQEREHPDHRDLTLWEHLQAQASAAGLSPADHGIALSLI